MALYCACMCVFACVQRVAVSLFIATTKISLMMQFGKHFHHCVFPGLPLSWFIGRLCVHSLFVSSEGKLRLFGDLMFKHARTRSIT